MTGPISPPTHDDAHDGFSEAWATRVEAARHLAAPCSLCVLRCGVDRHADERGRCGLGATTPVYSQMLSFGEERALSPSWLVNLSGCSMHCTFCSEDRHLRPPFAGHVTSAAALARGLSQVLPRQTHRARNINFVGGEPSISLPFLLEVAAHLARLWPQHPPLLLNTNGTMTEPALALCRGVFDVFVVDLKFGPGPCSRDIGKVPDTFEIVTARLRTLVRWREASLWVRHLVMPGHVECCTAPVVRWMAEALPHVPLNLMSHLVAFSGTRAERLWGTATPDELGRVRALAAHSGLSQLLWNGGALVA